MILKSTTFALKNNVTIVPLEFFQCFITDLPESGIDCSLCQSSICVKCETRGGYFTGQNEHDKYLGHIICYMVLAIRILIGIIGVISDALVILVLYRTLQFLNNKKLKAFDFLVLCSSYADFLSCLTSLSGCASHLVFHSKTYLKIIYSFYLITCYF